MNVEAIAIIKAHIPSVTREMDADEELYPQTDLGYYCGEQRVCQCGLKLEGYYDYVDHLITMLGGESHIGG